MRAFTGSAFFTDTGQQFLVRQDIRPADALAFDADRHGIVKPTTAAFEPLFDRFIITGADAIDAVVLQQRVREAAGKPHWRILQFDRQHLAFQRQDQHGFVVGTQDGEFA